MRGEKPDFWPVSKFNTGSLPLRGRGKLTPFWRKNKPVLDGHKNWL